MGKEPLTNVDITVFALASLGGGGKKVFTEDIAAKTFELAPERFSWKTYPEYPDLEVARIALMDARKEKHGILVGGRYGRASAVQAGDGWILTPKGVEWYEKNHERIRKALKVAESRTSPVARSRASKDLKRVRASGMFKNFRKTKGVSEAKPYEFTDLLEASLDTSPVWLRERINTLKAQAAEAKDEEILEFINTCEKEFSDLFRG